MVQLTDIQNLANRIGHEFRPDRVVLFGSYASGRPTPDSDVDLMVISDHPGKPWQLATQIRNRLRPSFPLDLIVRSPDELEHRIQQGDPFLKEIASHGRVLYEANNS